MSRTPSAAARAAAGRTAAATGDKLDRVRDALRKRRDLDIEKRDLEERASVIGVSIRELDHKTLPDIFNEAGVTTLGLEPEGNLPGYVATKKPYFHANISADWEPERKEHAFALLEKLKAGDLIKTVITVELGRGDRAQAKLVERALEKLKVSFSRDLAVPWNSLTAWLKAQIEGKGTTPPLEALGATVGEVVKLKPVQEKD